MTFLRRHQKEGTAHFSLLRLAKYLCAMADGFLEMFRRKLTRPSMRGSSTFCVTVCIISEVGEGIYT